MGTELNLKFKHVALFITVLFTIFEVLVAAGILEIDTELLPANLQTQDKWYQNPVIWVVALTIAVNFLGYIENVVVNDQPYDYEKFVETFYKYLPMMLILTQILPNAEGAGLAFVLDYLSRALKKPK